jgi:hypothetical protein
MWDFPLSFRHRPLCYLTRKNWLYFLHTIITPTLRCAYSCVEDVASCSQCFIRQNSFNKMSTVNPCNLVEV